ncbi:TIGR03618 family F420-dependent PPOX class oxidoreductase [Pseudonocardia sp. CA-142604]|uniref:TIGR03618 family F420-dependent PPOX class oxidoreductase n=1 Tax=Pseudonocardia sp. CA-142604 TaxID=3240024 RepID=UPI003D8C6894
MGVELPQGAKDLLDGRTYVVLTTIRSDGGPQSVVTWASRDGNDVLITTRRGVAKEVNINRDPRVSVCFFDPGRPGEAYTVYGSATLSEEGADDLVAEHSGKYVPTRPDPVTYLRRKGDDFTSPNVVIRVTPEKVREHH